MRVLMSMLTVYRHVVQQLFCPDGSWITRHLEVIMTDNSS
jgi:hypothetical protein